MNIIVGYLTPDSGNISIDCEVMSGQTYCSIEACLLNAQNDHLWSVQVFPQVLWSQRILWRVVVLPLVTLFINSVAILWLQKRWI
ncbi:MAG: hypothetical protein FD178_1741 [Ignavibacteria bacterium]|nr:MAG: hypothetical protein FD178_1741 [Ignavibacteria bacterium]